MLDTSEFVFEFSKKFEFERIVSTLRRLPWYEEQGYTKKHIHIPKGISENSTTSEIKEVLKKEYENSEYEDYKKILTLKVAEISTAPLGSLIGFKKKSSYTVFLTKYGSGGSYDSKSGMVIVNINLRDIPNATATIIHEIIHIGIQHLIDKYNISHWHKERLVDLIQEKLYPGIKQMQYIKQNVLVVDESFNNFFPDIESICREIGKGGV